MTTSTATARHENPRQSGGGKIGLVLSGGGARGAYQAGVLKAVGEITADMNLRFPIPIITGVSAGAVNAAFLAATCQDFQAGTHAMAKMWSSITSDRIFRTDAVSASRMGLKLLGDITLGFLQKKKLARALLDTTPLKAFLEESIAFGQIDNNLRDGCLQAVALTAMNYSKSTSVSFVHGRSDSDLWQRSRRLSEYAKLTPEHVMGSSAIPLIFPPIRVGDDHFGDGCLRNTAPLAPAIHLGANRLLVISARKPEAAASPSGSSIEPSLARVLGVVLNALLLDSIEIDMERLSRINSTIQLVPEQRQNDLSLHKVDYLWLRPSRDAGELAGDLFGRLPNVIRYLVGGLGSSREASELTSYLLFDPDFCGQLVESGYGDGMANRKQIEDFFRADG